MPSSDGRTLSVFVGVYGSSLINRDAIVAAVLGGVDQGEVRQAAHVIVTSAANSIDGARLDHLNFAHLYYDGEDRV